MPKTFAQLTTDTLQALQDTGAAIYGAAETASRIEDALREIPGHRSYLMREVFRIESRTGSSTTTTANALVDATKAQFLSTDVNKEIYNTTDNTWAKVTAYVSASQVTLSKDIMVSGEAYEMYNENCRSNKEIYIGDVTDYVGNNHGVLEDDAHAPEYPLGTKRNVKVSGDILTVLKDTMPDSGTLTNDLEVFVWFQKRHRVSQLTSTLGLIQGTVNGTPAAGAETLVVAGFTLVEVIAEDTLFTIAGIRGTYRIIRDTTLSAGAGTIYFWPGLDKTLTTGLVITVIGSTLNDRLERLVTQVVVGKALMSKAILDARTVPKGGAGQVGEELRIANDQYALAIQELSKGKPVGIKQTYSKD